MKPGVCDISGNMKADKVYTVIPQSILDSVLGYIFENEPGTVGLEDAEVRSRCGSLRGTGQQFSQ